MLIRNPKHQIIEASRKWTTVLSANSVANCNMSQPDPDNIYHKYRGGWTPAIRTASAHEAVPPGIKTRSRPVISGPFRIRIDWIQSTTQRRVQRYGGACCLRAGLPLPILLLLPDLKIEEAAARRNRLGELAPAGEDSVLLTVLLVLTSMLFCCSMSS